MERESLHSGRTAGLSLSVGRASLGLRLMLSAAALANSIVAAFGAQLAVHSAGRAGVVLAVGVLQPFALVLLIAAAYVAAPFSRGGIWLDRNLPRLRRRPVAAATAAGILLVSALGMALVAALIR